MKTWNVKINDDNHVLQLKKSSVNTNIWIIFTERNGVEIKGTRVVLQRIDRETKEFFGVK